MEPQKRTQIGCCDHGARPPRLKTKQCLHGTATARVSSAVITACSTAEKTCPVAVQCKHCLAFTVNGRTVGCSKNGIIQSDHYRLDIDLALESQLADC